MNFPVESAGFDDHLIMNTFKQDALYRSGQLPDILAEDHNVFRPDQYIHRGVNGKAKVHAGEVGAAEVDQLVAHHAAAYDVAFPDKVRHEAGGGGSTRGSGICQRGSCAAVVRMGVCDSGTSSNPSAKACSAMAVL